MAQAFGGVVGYARRRPDGPSPDILTRQLAHPMDPGLHVKQAINHLNKVLAYAPYVREGDEAVVALTPEDWQVVADALFRMNTPSSVFPDAITGYELDEAGHSIALETADGPIRIEVG